MTRKRSGSAVLLVTALLIFAFISLTLILTLTPSVSAAESLTPSVSAAESAAESETENKFCITKISPRNLQPADISTVSVTIKNIGSHSAFHVATEVETAEMLAGETGETGETTPVKVVGRAKKSVGTTSLNSLGCDREATVKYDFYVEKDAEASTYNIPLKVLWREKPEEVGREGWRGREGEENEVRSETLYFGVRVLGQSRAAEIDVVNVTTAPAGAGIKPGTEATLKIKLKNIGGLTVSRLKVRLTAEEPFTPLDSDLEQYLTDLKPNETRTAYFNLSVDREAASSCYELPLVLEYEDEFGSHEKNTSVGVSVKGSPRVLIQEIILEPSKLSSGTEGLLMIRLINTGTESAEDTKIRIAGAEGILTEGHQFIGEIAPDESETATFGVSVAEEEVETGKHGLTIKIAYEDEFGTSCPANSKIYEITVFESEPFLPTKYVYALAGVAAAAVVGYLLLVVRLKK